MPEALTTGDGLLGVIVPGVAGTPVQTQDRGYHAPRYISKQLVTVLYIISDCAGREMAFRWVVVIRGTSKPLLLDFTSSTADGSGITPFVLIPTPCPGD